MSTSSTNLALTRAQAIADFLALMPQIRAVALAGSVTAGTADTHSDLDLYVFPDKEPPRSLRAALACKFAGEKHPSIELEKPYWGSEDAWVDAESGLYVDLIYWTPDWIEAQLDRVLTQHQAQTGYSTAFWYTVLNAAPLFDRRDWFAGMQARARQPYPEALRRAVLRMNYPILRQSGSAYRHQIKVAIARRDRVSLNHRITALLASYFDIIFAANCQPQPGEKRLIQHTAALCTTLPEHMAQDINALLCSATDPWNAQTTLQRIDTLLDRLDAWLITQDLLTPDGKLL